MRENLQHRSFSSWRRSLCQHSSVNQLPTHLLFTLDKSDGRLNVAKGPIYRFFHQVKHGALCAYSDLSFSVFPSLKPGLHSQTESRCEKRKNLLGESLPRHSRRERKAFQSRANRERRAKALKARQSGALTGTTSNPNVKLIFACELLIPVEVLKILLKRNQA